MIKEKKTYNPNLIKTKRSYSFKEIAEVYNLHIRTVQSWKKQGLKILVGTFSPYLVFGEDLRNFLLVKKKRHKQKLRPGEFYCTKCHYPRKSHPDKIYIKSTDKFLGRNYKQVIIKGVCEICNTTVTLFSSNRIIDEMEKNGLLITKQEEVLFGNTFSSLNTDIEKETENVESKY